ncbi:MAG: hypothetical protein K0R03_280 [Moraxellaceae bacterium]|nr:hypothetical protein [Moraxellaceae bacterium]MDF3029722.1 hypothetical protein [Moraxellaceae bacterium]
MAAERRAGREHGNGPPRELDPARSKSVEEVEREVDEIVAALAARERARRAREAAADDEAGDYQR